MDKAGPRMEPNMRYAASSDGVDIVIAIVIVIVTLGQGMPLVLMPIGPGTR